MIASNDSDEQNYLQKILISIERSGMLCTRLSRDKQHLPFIFGTERDPLATNGPVRKAQHLPEIVPIIQQENYTEI